MATAAIVLGAVGPREDHNVRMGFGFWLNLSVLVPVILSWQTVELRSAFGF